MAGLYLSPFLLIHAMAFLMLWLPAFTLSTPELPHITPSASPPIFGNATDRLALLTFKSKLTDDPSEFLTSWNDSVNFCSWPGVTCGRRPPQRVVALGLQGLNLAGPISPSLANLTFLRRLHLTENLLNGHIPSELGRLFQLQYLNLSFNSLTGELPANLSHCLNLRIMSLRNNDLYGEIPSWHGSFMELRELNLALNRLTGHIPPSLANLSSVSKLVLGTNKLEGNIPVELGRMPNLQFLNVGENMLSGRIPPSLYNLSSLTVFCVDYNQLSGTIPPDIGQTLPHLQQFLLYGNSFQGPIPASFPNATGLTQLELGANQFGGVIPSNLGALPHLSSVVLMLNRLEGGEVDNWAFLSSLTNCSQLTTLQFDVNKIRGALPMSIANLSTKLEYLSMGSNHISGKIPPGIGNLVSLTALLIESCQLSGNIPYSAGKLQALSNLALRNNMLSGQIPRTLGNLTHLTHLWLSGNNLTGSIPTSFQHLTALESLDLSHNQLNTSIPKEVVGLSSLSRFLNLSHNSLTGYLPWEVGSLKNLGVFDVSENKLSGEIPTSVGKCEMLEYLRLQGNSFQGIIPPSLIDLKGLKVIDLSRNNLSGSIPGFLGNLKLEFLNLSFNNFEGELPREGVFRDARAISISGNKKLCGGDPVFKLPNCPVQTSRRRHAPKALVPTIVVVPVFCLIAVISCLLANRWRAYCSLAKPLAIAFPGVHFKRVSYGELLKATNGFSAENLIGEGSFGSVYKGILGQEEKRVAVKVLNLRHRGASKSFAAECHALRNVRHRNLVKILTSCSGIDFKGDEFKALVFEFMDNGSLEKWLHPERRGNPERSLSFVQRLNVAIDVAFALDYLHNHARPPVVHCDLKPSNILLDSDLCGCVSDFGLARFCLEQGREGSQTLSSTIGIKGSIGYIPPEYGMGGQASTLGDVYSYGILLLEMFTGKRPTADSFNEGLSLRKYVDMAFPEHVMEVMDPCMPLEEEDTEANGNGATERLERCVMSVFEMGLLCTKESPMERVDVKQMVEEMCRARDVYLGIGIHGRKRLNRRGARHEGPSTSA